MKRLCFLLALGFLSAPLTSQNQAGESSELPIGSVLRVRFWQPVEATNAKAGDLVKADVVGLVSGGRIKRPRQPLTLIGHVSEVKPRADGQRESRLGIAFDKILIGNMSGTQREIAVKAVVTRIVTEETSVIDSTSRVPTSGDDSIQRAAGPMVDNNGKPVYSHPQNSQPGPAGAKDAFDRAVKDLSLQPDAVGNVTVILCRKRDVVVDTGMYVIVKVTASGN